jgi:hypothetical protein
MEGSTLYDQLTDPDGRDAYRSEYGQDQLDAALQHMRKQIDRAAAAEGVAGSDTNTDGDDSEAVKPRSEYTRTERAEQYEKWRQEGKDPNEEWQKLPE